MLLIVFSALGCAASVLTAVLLRWNDARLLIIIPMAIGYFLAVTILFFLAIFVISLFIDMNKPQKRHQAFYRIIATLVVEFLDDMAGIRVHVTGAEKVPKDRRFLFVGNHISSFDPMIAMVRFWKERLSFISKPSNLKIPLAGPFIHKCCFLSINREDDREALKTILAAIDLIKNDQVSIGIYPEGTRSKTGRMGEFHHGSFQIARRAKCPIVVAVVRDTDKVKKNFPWKKTDVYMDIIDLIEPEEFEGLKTAEISERVYNEIAEFQKRKG